MKSRWLAQERKMLICWVKLTWSESDISYFHSVLRGIVRGHLHKLLCTWRNSKYCTVSVLLQNRNSYSCKRPLPTTRLQAPWQKTSVKFPFDHASCIPTDYEGHNEEIPNYKKRWDWKFHYQLVQVTGMRGIITNSPSCIWIAENFNSRSLIL